MNWEGFKTNVYHCHNHRSIVTKRCHDQGNAYESKHSMRGLLTVSEVTPGSSG